MFYLNTFANFFSSFEFIQVKDIYNNHVLYGKFWGQTLNLNNYYYYYYYFRKKISVQLKISDLNWFYPYIFNNLILGVDKKRQFKNKTMIKFQILK